MLESHDVQRAIDGDPQAFERIVRGSFARALRIAARVCAHEADAHDVVQEAFTRAFVALREGRFRGAQPQLQAWLDRIVVRAALDALRQRKRRERRIEAASDPDALSHSPDPASAIDARRALDAVQQLSAEQRAAWVLRELEGLTIREAAEALECSDGAIEQRVLRAWAALRRRFSP
jgi:RNA polymerase sigma-70 factor (ECF subfamily)